MADQKPNDKSKPSISTSGGSGAGQSKDDWAKEVPAQSSHKEEYGDYGWEKGESVLPEFRDPSVHEHGDESSAGSQHPQKKPKTSK